MKRNDESLELVAPNRHQGYRTTFRRQGIEISAGRRGDTRWRLSPALTGYGYEGNVRTLPAAEPIASNGRVEYRRGPVTEWYVNRPGGLEQGFEVGGPPLRPNEPLVMEMTVAGDLAAVTEGEGASFRDAAGVTVVRYVGLSASDADGRRLPARLSVAGRRLQLEVEAEGARFPLTIDPVFVSESRLLPHPDPAQDLEFGFSVSIDGDTLVVGAPLEKTAGYEAGAAYVFVRSGTVWEEQQKLLAVDGAAYDQFGWSVSISGETIVVGTVPKTGTGAAYVFTRSGTVWNLQQKLLASVSSGHFGEVVSASGDTIVVGSPFWDYNGTGSVFVFVRSGVVWTEQQRIMSPNGSSFDRYGESLSVHADTIVVGAAFNGPTGSAFVYVRSGTAWTFQQRLLPSDPPYPGEQRWFGRSVSLDGDTVVIGAEYDSLGPQFAGSAYVFVRSGTVWSQQQKLTASDAYPNARFGNCVSISGDTVAVSHYPLVGPDSVYVFTRSGSVWSEQQKLEPSDYLAGGFGISVAASGDTAVVGAYRSWTGSGVQVGSAYTFVRSGAEWSERQKFTPSPDPESVADDNFGYSVAVSGNTAVIGAPNDDTAAGENAGSAYVFVRSGTVWIEQRKLFAWDGAPGDQFGQSVSVFGDVAVVGAPWRSGPGGPGAGSAYVFVRTGTAWTQQQALTASDQGMSQMFFGSSVSVSNDTALIGAPFAAGVGVFAGAAYVFVKSGTVWVEQQKLYASDGAYGDLLGSSASVSEETALVGAYGGNAYAGSAYVFIRSGGVWSQQQKLVASDGMSLDFFGNSVSVAGDTALIGAEGDDTAGGEDAGSAYVFVRSGTMWSEQQKLTASGGAANDQFGISVSVGGDTALVGAQWASAAYVFVRSGTLWSEQQRLVAWDSGGFGLFGASVSVSDDMAVIGAPLDDTAGESHAGSAHIFRGLTATDAGVAKTDGQASAVPGTPVTYTITIGDAGPDPGVGIRVVDVPPVELTSVAWTCSASPGSSCPASGAGTIDHTANVDVGGTLTYTLTGTVSPSATGSLVNTVTVSPPAGVSDPVPGNDSATDTDILTPEADLALSLSDTPDPVASGAALTYTLRATNLGPSDSSGVTVTDTLPGVLTLVSSSPGCSTGGGTVTCALGGSTPNSSQAVTLQAIVNPGTVGSFSNTASLVGNETDPVASNDTAVELTQVSLRELGHGAALPADLRAAGGILADQDLYRIGQHPYSSYEVVVDATSGDIGSGQGPDLERLASDAVTAIQSSQAAGAGASRSMRWENNGAAPVNDQYVRVRSAGCTTTCTPEDVYRIRAWDTTLLGPRFNNSGTQVTLLVLQNTTDVPVTGHVYFWSASGTLLGAQPLSLAGRASSVLNTSTLPGAAGQSGSLTLSHDGRHGTVLGKAVSVEPATGFAFDTPLVARMR